MCLTDDVMVKNILHEMGHALGFGHWKENSTLDLHEDKAKNVIVGEKPSMVL